MDIAAFLASVPLFKGLPAPQIGRIARIAEARTYRRGQTVFSEGDRADGFYVAATGRVKIYKVSADGKEQILHIMGFQEAFGEVPVFAGGRFPAHARTLEESLLVFFPGPAFIGLIGEDPSLAMNMLALLSERLRQFAGLVEQLALKGVPARLASYIVYLSDRAGGAPVVELDIPRTLLANVLGTMPETLSRVLARMASEGTVGVEGRRITLLDRPRLAALSSGTAALP